MRLPRSYRTLPVERATERLLGAIAAADHVRRAAAERAAIVARALADARAREAERIARAYGDHAPVATTAMALARAHRRRAYAAAALAQERGVDRWSVPHGTLLIHGRVVDRHRVGVRGLRVVLTSGRLGDLETTGATDERGYFRLALRSPEGEDGTVVVWRDDTAVARTEPLPLVADTVTYLELSSGDLAPIEDARGAGGTTRAVVDATRIDERLRRPG